MNPDRSSQHKIITVVLVLVILAAIGVFVYRFRSPRVFVNRDLAVGLGQAVATETAKLLHDRGQIGIILAPVHEMEGQPEYDTRQAFFSALQQHPLIHIVATEVANTEPPIEYGLTRARLDKVLKEHPDIDGVVSFYGISQWDSRAPFELPRPDLKIIAVQSNPVPIKPYFARGALAVGIVRREIPAPNSATPRTPADWFAQNYQVFTVENYQSLPDEEAPQ